MALISLIVFSMLYYVLGMPLYDILNAVTDMGAAWPSNMRSALSLWINVTLYSGLIFLFCLLVWMITNSKKTEGYLG